MSKSTSTLSIAAVLAASALVFQAPLANAADAGSKSSTSAETQRGVPGVDVDLGKNASDKGVPGVEMNVGKDGDQKNLNKTETNKLGASSDTKTDDTKHRAARKDRN